jgi:hypothetical protein
VGQWPVANLKGCFGGCTRSALFLTRGSRDRSSSAGVSLTRGWDKLAAVYGYDLLVKGKKKSWKDEQELQAWRSLRNLHELYMQSPSNFRTLASEFKKVENKKEDNKKCTQTSTPSSNVKGLR